MNLDLTKYRKLELGERRERGDKFDDGTDIGCTEGMEQMEGMPAVYRPLSVWVCMKGDGLGTCAQTGKQCHHAAAHTHDATCDRACLIGVIPCIPFVSAIPDSTICSPDDLDAGDRVAAGVSAMFKAKYGEAKQGGAGHYEANIRAMEFVQGLIGKHLWAMATAQEGK